MVAAATRGDAPLSAVSDKKMRELCPTPVPAYNSMCGNMAALIVGCYGFIPDPNKQGQTLEEGRFFSKPRLFVAADDTAPYPELRLPNDRETVDHNTDRAELLSLIRKLEKRVQRLEEQLSR